MDIISKKCELCGGRGYYSVPDEADDYQQIPCSCEKGRELEEREQFDLVDFTRQFFNTTSTAYD